jgi:feruloyl-CoA synthase
MSGPAYRHARVGGCVAATLEERDGGVRVLRSAEALGEFPQRLTDSLEHWARVAPDRVFVAKRERGGDWRRITYAQMLQRAQAVGEWLAGRGLGVERPIAILSDNDLEHLTLALGAMWVGIPYAPVSPAYSLLSQDHGKLRHIVQTVTPGLVFASGTEYARAIAAIAQPGMDVVLTDGVLHDGVLPDGHAIRFDDLLAQEPGEKAAAAHAQVGPDTIVKFLFTSGSTKNPKGVVNTHRMLCANLQMIRQTFAFLQDEPPVLVDWLPWNHTFGGNHNVGITLYNGGTLYIDEGKPTAAGIHETLRNLREISPTIYFNVPKGFEEIASAMDHDDTLRQALFSRVKAFMFSGAGLSQAVWDKLDAHAERTVGERVRMLTGLGMTETAPSCTFAVGTDVRSGHIGLPCPGVEVKLVPMGDKTEIRFKGPNVMPHYWRAPEQTADAFDEEGFYRTGDAVKFIDPAQPLRGLMFDGRIAEDFKLSTGTFVSVGPLRARIILDGSPCVQDVVVTGLNRDDVGILVFPRVDECRKLAGLSPQIAAGDVLKHPKVIDFFQQLVDRQWHAGTGSANRVARALLLVEPPSIDRGEITDKGSINQRAVLTHREALVERLYHGGDGVLLPRRH